MQIQKQLKCCLRNSISLSHNSHHHFHSTPPSLAKWKNKWNSNYVRYSVRQKRADAKKALKDLLYNSGCTKPFQDVGRAWETDRASSWDAEEDEDEDSHDSSRKSRPKKSKRSSRAAKVKARRMNFCEDFEDDSGNVFEATFGNKRYTWSSRPFWAEEPTEFVWRDKSKWTRNKTRVWDSTSETDEDVKPCFVGSYSDRMTLGLPPTGPLKIDDVKSAFRTSALKWHPDKHQGPSQAKAEEKFKQCVDSYNCLCKALS
ncbi:hypothetical protein ACHQM5_016837 [Ranunculus cassubicifolius]